MPLPYDDFCFPCLEGQRHYYITVFDFVLHCLSTTNLCAAHDNLLDPVAGQPDYYVHFVFKRDYKRAMKRNLDISLLDDIIGRHDLVQEQEDVPFRRQW